MTNNTLKNRLPAILLLALLCAGCQAVKPYQRAYLNDDAMQPGHRPGCRFENNVQVYREGAAGGGGKTSGGCGCN